MEVYWDLSVQIWRLPSHGPKGSMDLDVRVFANLVTYLVPLKLACLHHGFYWCRARADFL